MFMSLLRKRDLVTDCSNGVGYYGPNKQNAQLLGCGDRPGIRITRNWNLYMFVLLCFIKFSITASSDVSKVLLLLFRYLGFMLMRFRLLRG